MSLWSLSSIHSDHILWSLEESRFQVPGTKQFGFRDSSSWSTDQCIRSISSCSRLETVLLFMDGWSRLM